ncbi:MAG TPA: SDR family NAD(P)-dependent oxidoreductase, partial [Chloroflexota bacterium]|nr:SDR family NAD(P)-dependent oxidoreductase [Chloroflexota bacterium]
MGADELSGKVALVTGAGRGIGLATAAELARLGAGLVLIDRQLTVEALSLLSNVSEDGRTAVGKRIDLADEDAAGSLKKLIVRLPPIQILVNNAGWLRTRPFLEVPLDEWQHHLDVNLTGMFL